MAYYRCDLSAQGERDLDGLTVETSSASIQNKPAGSVFEAKAAGTITIKFPEGIDLSQYNTNGGSIDISKNSLSISYTLRMTGGAVYCNANVSSSTISLTKNN